MKKLLWISIALALIGCGKQAQAETTVTPTTIVSETTAETTTETTTLSETTVAIVEETISGDQHQPNQDMMNVIRQEVIDGDIKGELIDEEVDMWCDFLSDTEKDEFKRELHLLEAKEAEVVPETTKPQSQETKSQTSSKSKETQAKPVSQPTQSTEVPQQIEPKVTEVYQEPVPTPQPETQTQNNGGGIDTSGWNTGGGATIEQRPLDENQNLSPGELADIESVDFN